MDSNNHNIDFAFKLHQEVKLTDVQAKKGRLTAYQHSFTGFGLCMCGVNFECLLLELVRQGLSPCLCSCMVTV